MKCPVCGSNDGFYSKEYVTYCQMYDENGECTHFGDMINVSKRKSIPLYCIDCNKRVTTLDKLKNIGE